MGTPLQQTVLNFSHFGKAEYFIQAIVEKWETLRKSVELSIFFINRCQRLSSQSAVVLFRGFFLFVFFLQVSPYPGFNLLYAV